MISRAAAERCSRIRRRNRSHRIRYRSFSDTAYLSGGVTCCNQHASAATLTGSVSDMRASRLVSIILLLQARGRMTAEQLAAELEVSVRTIYRDVGSLHSAGIPLYGDAGPAGGYRLLDGYRTRLTGMTGAEVEALALAAVPGPAPEPGL